MCRDHLKNYLRLKTSRNWTPHTSRRNSHWWNPSGWHHKHKAAPHVIVVLSISTDRDLSKEKARHCDLTLHFVALFFRNVNLLNCSKSMEYRFLRYFFRNNYFYNMFDILLGKRNQFSTFNWKLLRNRLRDYWDRHCWIGEGSKSKVAGIIIGQTWQHISHLFSHLWNQGNSASRKLSFCNFWFWPPTAFGKL